MILYSLPLRARAEDDFERQSGILFISSYDYSKEAVSEQLEGFEKGIEGVNADISYEFMDAERYYSAIDIMNFDRYLRHKVFSKRDYDLIVVADDPALRYAINNRDALFQDIPIVFMGINSKTEAVTAAAMKNATGIAESLDFEGNYALMKSLFPDRKRIKVVVDSSVAGQADYVEFMKFREKHEELDSTIINTSYYTSGGLKDLLGSLGNDDVILFLDFSVDGEKNNYSLKKAAAFLSEYAPDIPIFRLTSSDVGYGVLGGITYSYYEAGRMAGETCKKILAGESADDMPLVVSAVTTPFFEQGSMDRFGIHYSQLPEGSTVINEHRNLARFYRENSVLSNLVIVIVFLMIAIIILLYVSNHRRKKMIRTDFMTQMPNRMKIIEDVNQIISQSTPYGVIMLDVDHFKQINDTHGHLVGDEIIIAVGKRLKDISGKELRFARLGGDEFCGIFLSPSPDRAKKICEDIIKSTHKKFKTSVGDLKITVSMGCAMYPIDTKDNRIVIECADKALYVTKEKGRNGYTLFGSVNKTR